MYEGRPYEGAEFKIGSERKTRPGGLDALLAGDRQLTAEHLREITESVTGESAA
jgi:hypothetical protein